MAEQKTKPGTGDVNAFIDAIADDGRRRDAQALIELMGAVTGEKPVLWGTMVGFGQYHYTYATGHEGDSFLVGFAPRKTEFSLYLMGTYFPGYEDQRDRLLAKLGRHRMGKACLYVRKLADIDMLVLRELAAMSVTGLLEHHPAK